MDGRGRSRHLRRPPLSHRVLHSPPCGFLHPLLKTASAPVAMSPPTLLRRHLQTRPLPARAGCTAPSRRSGPHVGGMLGRLLPPGIGPFHHRRELLRQLRPGRSIVEGFDVGVRRGSLHPYGGPDIPLWIAPPSARPTYSSSPSEGASPAFSGRLFALSCPSIGVARADVLWALSVPARHPQWRFLIPRCRGYRVVPRRIAEEIHFGRRSVQGEQLSVPTLLLHGFLLSSVFHPTRPFKSAD